MVAVAGPTGSGKSELSLRIAREFQGEIVNCDSLQVYRYLTIGTAKLSEEERQGIPHHMVDVFTPDQVTTAGEYARRARPALAEIAGRGHLPVVVGGTGFYLKALLEGLFPGPERDIALRERLHDRERRRPGSLHRILLRLDPPSARRIHPNDIPKLVRALEITLLTKRPLSENFRQSRDALHGFRVLKLGLAPPRTELYSRLDRRLGRMFASGLLDEVRTILSKGYARSCKPFESLGYKQALAFLAGELSLDDAIAQAQRETRHYAKRQITWFRREAGMEWLAGFGEDASVQTEAIERVRKFLAS